MLYLFVTSGRPDVYINSIGHCVGEYGALKVALVDILEDRGRRKQSEHRLDEIRSNITRQLDALVQGKYLVHVDGRDEVKEVTLERHEMQRYSDIRSIGLEKRTWISDDLEEEILAAAEAGGIFDASGVSKVQLARVLGVLIRTGHRGLFVFELLRWERERSYDEHELIHALHVDRDYRFQNLVSEMPSTIPPARVTEAYLRDFSTAFALMILVLSLLPVAVVCTLIASSPWDEVE